MKKIFILLVVLNVFSLKSQTTEPFSNSYPYDNTTIETAQKVKQYTPGSGNNDGGNTGGGILDNNGSNNGNGTDGNQGHGNGNGGHHPPTLPIGDNMIVFGLMIITYSIYKYGKTF